MQDITLDATNKILGRLASEIAILLRGKDLPTFAPNRIPARKITIKNAAAIKVTGQKMTQKIYYRHSMYPGGLKARTFAQVQARNPARVLELAVYGMLPKNRLRAQMMKSLTIEP